MLRQFFCDSEKLPLFFSILYLLRFFVAFQNEIARCWWWTVGTASNKSFYSVLLSCSTNVAKSLVLQYKDQWIGSCPFNTTIRIAWRINFWNTLPEALFSSIKHTGPPKLFQSFACLPSHIMWIILAMSLDIWAMSTPFDLDAADRPLIANRFVIYISTQHSWCVHCWELYSSTAVYSGK